MPTRASAAPLSRRFGAAAFLAITALVFLTAPGRITADTKLDLTANPIGFLDRAANLWSSQSPFGQVQNQAYGYFFPHGAFFAIADLVNIPPWITQRLWWALILFAGFWGIVRLAEAAAVGSRSSRVIAACAFVLAPRVLTTIGAISSETAAMMLAPWVLVPIVLALNPATITPNSAAPSLRMLAARSAAAVALMGGVNAVATVMASAVGGLWWLLHLRARDRRFWTFTAWWIPSLALATLWWLVALVIMGKVSPPFLDYIESARATTRWVSLPEILRGTSAWTPFVSPERVAGTVLVTTPAAVVTTGLIAAAGIAGLTMRRMPARGRWLTIATVGIVAIGAGYVGGLGSPWGPAVQVWLDGTGAPLRNVHKLEPLVRIPLVLGIAHLLARAPLPGTVPWRTGLRALAHPERSRLTATAIAVMVVIGLSGGLAWTGKLAPQGPYQSMPSYWTQAADWLTAHATGTAPGQAGAARALVVPGAPFAAQLWGLTRDEPLQPLAHTPWAVRDSIPLTPSSAIRAMDSVQQLFATGTPAPGLANTLLQQGIRYVVLRADLDPSTSRSARPVLAKHVLENSPGIAAVTSFGPATGPRPVPGVVVDSGLRPRLPAITIYRVDGTYAADGGGPSATAAGPYSVPLGSMPWVLGGAESLLRVQGVTPGGLGPVLLHGDALAAALPGGTPVVVTDSPKAREVDFGRLDDHASAVRAQADPRRSLNAAPDYDAGEPLVWGEWTGAQLRASSSSSDSTQFSAVQPGQSLAAVVDNDANTAWVSGGLDHAVGQWIEATFPQQRRDLAVSITLARASGPAVTRVLVTTEAGQTLSDPITIGQPIRITAPSGPSKWIRITAADTTNHTAGTQFAVTALTVLDAGTLQPVPIRHTVVLPTLPSNTLVSQWVLTQELAGRSACAETNPPAGAAFQCAAAMAVGAEEPGTFARVLSVPSPVTVTPQITLRPRTGTALTALLRDRAMVTATGAAETTDIRGSAAAATDGDPATAWSAPQTSTASGAPKPLLRLTLPSAQRVTALSLSLPRGASPAAPTKVAINLGTGRQIRTVPTDGSPIRLDPAVTDAITISILDWQDRININSIGFAEKVPPGISEVTVLGGNGAPVPGTAQSAAAPTTRTVTVSCADGPSVAVSGRILKFSITATAAQLINGDSITATPCPGSAAAALAWGRQELTVQPGPAFSVDTVSLTNTAVTPPISTTRRLAAVDRWTADYRGVLVASSTVPQVLVVPESANRGWQAVDADGHKLPSVTVNGWQQGWIIPAGPRSMVRIQFPLNGPYRIALFGGLTLLLILAALAVVPGGGRATSAPSRPWNGAWFAGAGALAAAFALGGWGGAVIAVGVAAGLVGVAARWPTRAAALTVGAAGSLTALAMCALARGPWLAPSGYAGFDAAPQALALAGLLVPIEAAVLWSGWPWFRHQVGSRGRVGLRGEIEARRRASNARSGSSTTP